MHAVREWLGVELDDVSWKEKAVSIAGGALAIGLIYLICQRTIGFDGSAMIVSSMGASAVLVFAVPHGQLSQPWPVLAGHIGSALIGVTCAEVIPTTKLAAAVAVGLAIGAMHQFKCIHPPGGATALTAVIGGPAIGSLGYDFVWKPVALNAVVIVAVGVAFNWMFPWRRYPTVLMHRRLNDAIDVDDPPADDLTHEDVMQALRTLDPFVDVTEDDLRRLHHLLTRRQRRTAEAPTPAIAHTDPTVRPAP